MPGSVLRAEKLKRRVHVFEEVMVLPLFILVATARDGSTLLRKLCHSRISKLSSSLPQMSLKKAGIVGRVGYHN